MIGSQLNAIREKLGRSVIGRALGYTGSRNQRKAMTRKASAERKARWADFINRNRCSTVLEVGVWQGKFSEAMLVSCSGIARYYMLDPWRHLSNWNKPRNVDDATFEWAYARAVERTEPFATKRVILRGTTLEMIARIPPESLDLVYIDGDHTLRGIALDLLSVYDCVKPSGFIAGDDFLRDSFHHGEGYDPTSVYPFAVYFAEAKDHVITELPGHQFLIEKASSGFRFDETL